MDTKVKSRDKCIPIKQIAIAVIFGAFMAIMLAFSASADGVLVGNVTSEVFDYTTDNETSVNDWLLSVDCIESQFIDNEWQMFYATDPSLNRTFDGVTTIDKTWTAETTDIDGIKYEVKAEQTVNGYHRGIRFYLRVKSWGEETFPEIIESRVATIYGENGGTISVTINRIPRAQMATSDDIQSAYDKGEENGYKRGQLNPSREVYDAIWKSAQNDAWADIQSTDTYERGYINGMEDAIEIYDISGLSNENTAMSALMIPLNSCYQWANSLFNNIYDSPIGIIVMIIVGVGITGAVVSVFLKFLT